MNGYCKLFIYKNCKILKNKNFKVDDIQSYLSTLNTLNKVENGTTTAIQGQWMKHQLKLKYIIEFAQTGFDGMATAVRGQEFLQYNDFSNFNYLSAENYDLFRAPAPTPIRTAPQGKVYYFIVGKKWISENSIELELEMDVINTLIDNYSLNPEQTLSLSPKTTILRQHKDRWKVGNYVGGYFPKIDLYSENILPILYKTDEATLYQWSDGGDMDFGNYYIIFKSQTTDENSPVHVYLCCDASYKVSFSAYGFTGTANVRNQLRPNNFNACVIYGGDTPSNVGCSVSFDFFTSNTHFTRETLTINNSDEAIFIDRKIIQKVRMTSSGYTNLIKYQYNSFANKEFENVFFEGLFSARYGLQEDIWSSNPITINNILSKTHQNTDFPPQSAEYEWNGISDIDRTDPKLLKIIKLPYKPSYFHINSDGKVDVIPDGWKFDATNNLMVLIDPNLTECFSNDLHLDDDDESGRTPTGYFEQMQIRALMRGEITTRKDTYETKLKHSDYFVPRFVYDSFSYDFKGEYMDDIDGAINFVVDFYITATMNSKFMFKFRSVPYKTDIENYSLMLYVARNNELPVFNSAYINYIRTGYNYDIKTKNRQLAGNIVQGTAQTIGAIASAAAGGPIGWAGGIGLGISAFTKFYSAVFNNCQAEQNIAQKLKSSELQGLSVIGSDDVDLMTEYTNGNKAKLCLYECSEKMKKCLADLFYYCGYVANFQGIPDTTSRMWFNFVMADPVFEYEQNYPQELIEELSKKYREGITYLHRVVSYELENEVDLWDFEQEKENWEKECILSPYFESDANPQYILSGIEYVINNNLSGLSSNTSVSQSNTLIWRKRRKSDMKIIAEKRGCFIFQISPSNNLIRAGYDNSGVPVYIDTAISDYASADYYITFEVGQGGASYTNQAGLKSAIVGKVSYH